MRKIPRADHCFSLSDYLDDHDLDRYYLGQIEDQEELAHLEEHYLNCPCWAEQVAVIEDVVDAIRVALPRAAGANGVLLDPGQRPRKSAWACGWTSLPPTSNLFHWVRTWDKLFWTWT
jgi:hypothetical protein